VGRLCVFYKRPTPESDCGPFLKGEIKLIQTIADRIGHFILHQRLSQMFTEMNEGRHGPSDEKAGWRIALDLLRNTDQNLFIRVSRKMMNCLGWRGVAEARSLLQRFGEDREADGVFGESNAPQERSSLERFVKLSDETFRIASANLSDEDIMARIQKSINEDRSSATVKALENVYPSLNEVLESFRRYQRLIPEGIKLPRSTFNSVRVALIRRFFTEQLEFINIAKKYVELEDFFGLMERIIFPSGSHGKLGGKSAGLFLASRILRLVPGLGTRAVDRVSDDYPILVAPSQPNLRVNVSLDEVVWYSPKKIDVIDLEENRFETLDIRDLLKELGSEFPALAKVISIYRDGLLQPPMGLATDFSKADAIVTFDGLISGSPFMGQLESILKTLEAALGVPVDIEFASDGKDFYLLQCRPQSHSAEDVAMEIPSNIPEEHLIFTANRYISNGKVADITHIIKVLRVLMNADREKAVALLAEPGAGLRAVFDQGAGRREDGDHARWRLRMAEQIAFHCDAERWGVRAIYIFGEPKAGVVSPGSPIKLAVNFQGTPQQRKELEIWLHGWSLSLAEMNYLRTGFHSEGLLDVHIVGGEDVKGTVSVAARVNAPPDSLQELPLGAKLSS